jgi:hypothetical protein
VTERVPKETGPERVEDAGPVGVEKEMHPGKAKARGRVVAVGRDEAAAAEAEIVRANRTVRDEEDNSKNDIRKFVPKGEASCQAETERARWVKVR